jgi:hypothetical protein
MQKIKLIFVLFFSVFLFSGCTPEAKKTIVEKTVQIPTLVETPRPQVSELVNSQEETPEFTASFEIQTNGIKRVFTQAMYHNLSPDVFIASSDPSTIVVKKAGVTWDDFFKTLPFSLTKNCLTTGTKQTFCSSESKALRFYLNDKEMPAALDSLIEANDHLRVTYENYP